MARTCDDCGETFDTLSSLRLHDCSAAEDDAEDDIDLDEMFADRREERQKQRRAENSAAREAAPAAFSDALDQVRAGEHDRVYELLAHYDRHLSTAWENYGESNYWGFHRVFDEQVIEAVTGVVDARGWSFLLELLDAYWPTVEPDYDSYPDHEPFGGKETDEYEDFTHASYVLTTVTGQQTIRTRQREGVDAIPTRALEYQLLGHRHPGDSGAWLDSMSYGWGVGHPDHDLIETLTTLVDGEYEIWASTAIQHGLLADQHATTTLIEDLFGAGLVSEPGLILRDVGALDRGKPPDVSDAWDWESLDPVVDVDTFVFDPGIRDRLRTVAEESGFAANFDEDWTLADLIL